LSKYDKNTMKPTQRRRTFEDTLNAQAELRAFLKSKIKDPVLKPEEIKRLPSICARALLSQGAQHNFQYSFTSVDKIPESGVMTFGDSFHATLLKMPKFATSRYVDILPAARRDKTIKACNPV